MFINDGITGIIELTVIQESVLCKLVEQKVSLFDSDKKLRCAFTGTVLPRACYHIAKELQEKVKEVYNETDTVVNRS